MVSVSVIIPLYNKALFIDRSIRSVLAQSYSDFELIVVDDGSTDEGPTIASKYLSQKVKLHRQENRGPGLARNVGMRMSNGEYLAFLDADDEWAPDFLMKSMEVLGDNSGCVAVNHGWYEGAQREDQRHRFQGQGITAGPWRLDPNISPIKFKHAIDFFLSGAVLCRREIIMKYGGYYEKSRCTYAEDSYLWIQVALNHWVYRNPEPMMWFHSEASELGSARMGFHPVRPILLDPDPVRKSCPSSHKRLLENMLGYYAILTACDCINRTEEEAFAYDIMSRYSTEEGLEEKLDLLKRDTLRRLRWVKVRRAIHRIPWLNAAIKKIKSGKNLQVNLPENYSYTGNMEDTMHAVFLPFDEANPYQRALAAALSELGVRIKGHSLEWRLLACTAGMDVVHIHWTYGLVGTRPWKFVLGYPVLACQFALLRLIGRRIVWTVHNIENHEKRNRIRDRLLSLLIGHLANNVLVHGESARLLVAKKFGIPHRKISVIPHGNYIGFYPDEIGRGEARRRLGVGDTQRILLFLGHIRPYKGVEELIEVFKSLATSDATLIIAGRPLNPEVEQRVRVLLHSDPRIQFHAGFVDDERIQVFMNASDAVVFPYKDVLTSGAVLLAMSFGKACIAPKLGCITDVLDEQGSFLYDAADSKGLILALEAALKAGDRLSKMGHYNRKRVEYWSWNRIASKTRDVYRGRMPAKFNETK